jgi:DNA-binding NarL/FixJ family response regulator
VLAGGSRGALGELTTRELEVLQLVAQGLSDAEIADRLVVSPHTVHRHVANVRSKLRLPSRAAAVAYAAREGLL